ncbi:hypothetical protein LZ32DRAFT_416629 [Colletotrichum eremochloae]|nr:hypothetical protein LZ32DRAFT_416629 [Colletotrichum eremochloae]
MLSYKPQISNVRVNHEESGGKHGGPHRHTDTQDATEWTGAERENECMEGEGTKVHQKKPPEAHNSDQGVAQPRHPRASLHCFPGRQRANVAERRPFDQDHPGHTAGPKKNRKGLGVLCCGLFCYEALLICLFAELPHRGLWEEAEKKRDQERGSEV